MISKLGICCLGGKLGKLFRDKPLVNILLGIGIVKNIKKIGDSAHQAANASTTISPSCLAYNRALRRSSLAL